MVRIHPDPPASCLRWLIAKPPVYCMTGGLAQLGEHLLCKQGVVGSIPSSSTNSQCWFHWRERRKMLAVQCDKHWQLSQSDAVLQLDIGCRSLTIRKK